jgi:hypothetical protein
VNGVVDLAHWQSVPDQTTKYQKVKISQPEAKRSLGSTIIRHQKEIRNLVDFYLSRLDTSATLGELFNVQPYMAKVILSKI